MKVDTVTCRQCDGAGKAFQPGPYPGSRFWLHCGECRGSGKIGVLLSNGRITKSWPYVEDQPNKHKQTGGE